MDAEQNNFLQELIFEIKNSNVTVDISVSEAQECVTALKQRLKKLKSMGARKQYLHEIYKLIEKFNK